MPIHSYIEPVHNLTINRIYGVCQVKEVEAALNEYVHYAPTLHELWDVRLGSARMLTPGDIQRLVDMASVEMSWRTGGRSAAVLTGTLNFGIGRVLESVTRLAGLPYEYRSFDNFEKALSWITQACDNFPKK